MFNFMRTITVIPSLIITTWYATLTLDTHILLNNEMCWLLEVTRVLVSPGYV